MIAHIKGIWWSDTKGYAGLEVSGSCVEGEEDTPSLFCGIGKTGTSSDRSVSKDLALDPGTYYLWITNAQDNTWNGVDINIFFTPPQTGETCDLADTSLNTTNPYTFTPSSSAGVQADPSCFHQQSGIGLSLPQQPQQI